jgi:aminoglycoside phosphotransferase (APT) family kinase protein
MADSIDPLEVARALRAHFEQRAASLGLAPGQIQVDYVLNWGGFVNASFRIGDPEPKYHVKLTSGQNSRASLAAWHRIHADLTANYHAPPVLGWIEVPGTDLEGLLFPQLSGTVPTEWPPTIRDQILPVIHRLHADLPLRARVGDGHPIPTCAESFRDDFLERFDADLDAVAQAPPAFVDPPLLAWMRHQVHVVTDLVTGSAAFQAPADAVIHGDLWPNNLLVTPDQSWYLLDWDDCRIGDPVLDLVKLFDDRGASDLTAAALAAVGTDQAAAERAGVYWRAVLLDWVIDPLADYIDADQAPDHATEVRAQKKSEHQVALARYRARYQD